ncbi:hypothetical protein PoHVEF18_002625 [Penicillium ochrochloron]
MPTEAIQGGPAGNGGKKPGPKGIKKVPGAPSVIPAGLFSASSAAGASVAAAGPVAPEDPDASEAEDAPAQEAYVERSLESRM